MQQVEKYQLTPYLDLSTINILLFTHTDREGNIYMSDHQDTTSLNIQYDFPKYKNSFFS